MSQHVRVQLRDKPLDFGTCPDHPKRPIEFYCVTCHKAICINCKINGSHSGIEQSQHGVLDINQAYTEAKNDCTDVD